MKKLIGIGLILNCLICFGQFKGVKLSEMINSSFEELSPCLSPDGNTMYFVRKGHPENLGGDNLDQDVWYAVKDPSGNWQKAKNIGAPINSNQYNGIGGVGKNGALVLINYYEKEGGLTPGVSIVKQADGEWKIPQDFLPKNKIGESGYLNFWVSENLKTVIVSTSLKEGDLEDLYVIENIDGKWSDLISLGSNINTSSYETSPFLTRDGLKLFYTSDGDIKMSQRLDTTSWVNWSEPVKIDEVNTDGFDGYFMLDREEKLAYFVSGETPEANGDIYSIPVDSIALLAPQIEEVTVKAVLVKGFVLNEKNNEPIVAKIKITDLHTNMVVDSTISVAPDGAYQIELERGGRYSITAEKEEYFSISELVDLTNYDEDDFERNIKLAHIEVGQTIKMNNIFFELDRAVLNEESFPELDRLAKLLAENPKMKIEKIGRAHV